MATKSKWLVNKPTLLYLYPLSNIFYKGNQGKIKNIFRPLFCKIEYVFSDFSGIEIEPTLIGK